MSDLQESWPSGATWVFQGTIAEDASAGTHICTLTVSPGIGNEMIVLYGDILVGNTATAQVVRVASDDGTNTLGTFLNGLSGTTANQRYGLFATGVPTPGSGQGAFPAGPTLIISGTMRLVLSVQTTAVSVTQTFAIVCRFRGMSKPTATLADSVGTPTLTTNTNQVF